MPLNVFLSLLLVFGFNEKTLYLVETSGAFSPSLKKTLGISERVEDALNNISETNCNLIKKLLSVRIPILMLSTEGAKA